ncbi:hypothetical protein QJR61_19335 [Yersinia intermedia]
MSRDIKHSPLSPIVDKDKEQNRLREAQFIDEVGGQVFDIISTYGQIQAATAAKDARAKSDTLTPALKR